MIPQIPTFSKLAPFESAKVNFSKVEQVFNTLEQDRNILFNTNFLVYLLILLFQRLWISNGKRNAQARLSHGIFIYKSVCALFSYQIFSLPSLSLLCHPCEFCFRESNSKPIIEVKFCEAKQNGVPAIGKGKTKT